MAANKEQIQKAFVQWFTKLAKSQNKDPQSYAQELGEDGMKQAYQKFVQEMQNQVSKSQYGSKLNYIKQISNSCPDGTTPTFFKKGGRICKACMGKKMEEGGQTKRLNEVQKFKLACKGAKMKKK